MIYLVFYLCYQQLICFGQVGNLPLKKKTQLPNPKSLDHIGGKKYARPKRRAILPAAYDWPASSQECHTPLDKPLSRLHDCGHADRTVRS